MKNLLTRGRHRLLGHCGRCAAWRCISPIICLDYMLRTSIDLMKEKGFKLAKERNRRYPAKTIMAMDFTDDIVLLVNLLIQAESLLHSLE